MALNTLARQLMMQEIFRGLSPLQLTEIVRNAERVVYRPGQCIIEAGKEGDAAIVVVAGDAVRLPDGGMAAASYQAQAVGTGCILGELAMLVEHVHGATIVAHTTVRVLRITREALHAQMMEDPDLASHFVNRITERLNRVADELRQIDHGLATQSVLEPA